MVLKRGNTTFGALAVIGNVTTHLASPSTHRINICLEMFDDFLVVRFDFLHYVPLKLIQALIQGLIQLIKDLVTEHYVFFFVGEWIFKHMYNFWRSKYFIG